MISFPEIELPYTFRGDGYMMFKPASEAVQFVWYNGIAFRTRALNGLLMSVEVRSNKKIQLEVWVYCHAKRVLSILK